MLSKRIAGVGILVPTHILFPFQVDWGFTGKGNWNWNSVMYGGFQGGTELASMMPRDASLAVYPGR